MATTTNTNTITDTIVSADIYDLASFYNEIRKANIPDVNDEASMVGIFGHITEMFMQTMQNTIIMTAETTNETIPTKAKFTKNVITHALSLGINDINASPAVMKLMLYLPVSYLEQNFAELDKASGKAKFILDNKIPFNIEGFEFHLDYDIIINRLRNSNGTYVYTAMYDLFESGTNIIKQKNPLSNINNPYIDTIIQATISDVKFIALAVDLHQVTYKSITKNIVTDNIIENKTITFSFEGQISAFDIDIYENGKTIHLYPIYNGLLDYTVEDGTWCYYEYVDENTIRILFSRDSFVPSLGSDVVVNIYESQGSNGNFTYNNQLRTSLKSSKYNNYNGMYAYIFPLNNGRSFGGKDRKSVEELKKIIPREATSRGAIINMTDLKNFFNSVSSQDCQLYFKKKRDNPFERMYYTYMIMKNNGNIYPTNTLSLIISKDLLKSDSSGINLSLPPGTKFYYYDHGNQTHSVDLTSGYCTLEPPEYVEPDDPDAVLNYNLTLNSDGMKVRVFEYILPFLITIDSDLITSYLLTIMDDNKSFKFDSINTLSDLQFISTYMNWSRSFYKDDGSTYDNKYVLNMSITQNNIQDYNLIDSYTDESGNIVFNDVRTKVFIVFYTDETKTTPYRYKEAEIVNYDSSRYVMQYKCEFETNDDMDLKNRIKILGVKHCKPEPFQTLDEVKNSYGYMKNNTYAKIFILADFGTKAGDVSKEDKNVTITKDTEEIILYGSDGIGNRTEIESIIPTRDNIIDAFLRNELSITRDNEIIDVCYIIRNNPSYIAKVKQYNQDNSTSSVSILKYLRNNKSSDFVLNTLLKDELSEAVIESYSYEDLSRYTVCNTMIVDGGVDFYHDYSKIMRSTIEVNPVRLYDNNDKPLFREVVRYDASGNKYSEFKPAYASNTNGQYIYNYLIDRVPLIKAGYLSTESLVQNFISALEERRRYIDECLYILEDTFDIDFKFVNTYGPSRTFYYNDPTAKSYYVTVSTKELNVYSEITDDDNESLISGVLKYSQVINILKTSGQWGYIEYPYTGWVKLSDTTRMNTFVDNVAINMKYSMQVESSADKTISNNIINDIKYFIEDINQINELHIPNIITLITNNYREQITWFDFLGLNNYGIQCKHLYVYENENDDVDIVPEFINIETSNDGLFSPLIDITIS